MSVIVILAVVVVVPLYHPVTPVTVIAMPNLPQGWFIYV